MDIARDDTIYALSSGLLPSGVAIIRVSGPKSRFVIETIAKLVPEPRKAVLGAFYDPENDEILDKGLILWFPGPASFTGEDMLELHCHGGRAVVHSLFRVLSGLSGLRMAERGEFTKRAFLNGKMDFVAVEGFSDLIAAETDIQRRLAQAQARGEVGSVYEDWRHRLIKARALIEAELDFPDEEDVPGSVSQRVEQDIGRLIVEMQVAAEGTKIAERVRDGVSVVLAGAPNAGKSSLFNYLAGREAAIVNATAGTTRDIIDVYMELDGVPLRLSDTAGLRRSDDEVERIGISKAEEYIRAADIVLYLEDVANPSGVSHTGGLVCEAEIGTDRKVLKIGTKKDCLGANESQSIRSGYDHLISITTEEGIASLIADLRRHAGEMVKGAESLVAIRSRHREAIQLCLAHLQASLQTDKAIELKAEDLRLAADTIGRVTGRVDVEDLLDVVFREFCIGK